MNSVDETTQDITNALNPLRVLETIQRCKYMFDSVKGIYDFFGKKTQENSTDLRLGQQPAPLSTYNFTGQHSDIVFCMRDNNKLHISELKNITDDSIRRNTYHTFDDAMNDGYVTISADGQNYVLTQKGIDHVHTQSFMQQFEKDQKNSLVSNKRVEMAYTNLKGNKNDLEVFKYTDSLNLNHLSKEYPKAAETVKNYLYKCKDSGFVTIENDIVKPTDKCKKYLSSVKSRENAVEPLTADNLTDVSVKMEKVKNSIKPEPKNVNATAGTAAKSNIVNFNTFNASQKTAQAASASVKTAAAGTKATAAASGAATAGVGTVVTLAASAITQTAKKANTLTQTQPDK